MCELAARQLIISNFPSSTLLNTPSYRSAAWQALSRLSCLKCSLFDEFPTGARVPVQTMPFTRDGMEVSNDDAKRVGQMAQTFMGMAPRQRDAMLTSMPPKFRSAIMQMVEHGENYQGYDTHQLQAAMRELNGPVGGQMWENEIRSLQRHLSLIHI